MLVFSWKNFIQIILLAKHTFPSGFSGFMGFWVNYIAQLLNFKEKEKVFALLSTFHFQ